MMELGSLGSYLASNYCLFKILTYLFIWLGRVSVVSCRIFHLHCGMPDL